MYVFWAAVDFRWQFMPKIAAAYFSKMVYGKNIYSRIICIYVYLRDIFFVRLHDLISLHITNWSAICLIYNENWGYIFKNCKFTILFKISGIEILCSYFYLNHSSYQNTHDYYVQISKRISTNQSQKMFPKSCIL